MKTLPLLLVTILLTGAAAAVVFTIEVKAVGADRESLMINAAYRDGLYQGKMDAKENQFPHQLPAAAGVPTPTVVRLLPDTGRAISKSATMPLEQSQLPRLRPGSAFRMD